MLENFFNDEQMQKIVKYKELIHQYHDELHLVSDKALQELDTYILDCAHLWKIIQNNPTIIDVGSGNGLPGIILGIMGASGLLVDSHKKKVIFLEHAVKELNLNMKVISHSIRNLENADEKWIIARGFGPLERCLEATEKLWNKTRKGLFIKSLNIKEEMQNALAKKWKFYYNIHDRYMQGTVLEVKNVKK